MATVARCRFTVYLARPDLKPLNREAFKQLYNDRHGIIVDASESAEFMDEGMVTLPWLVGRGPFKFIAGFYDEPLTERLTECPTFPDIVSEKMEEAELRSLLASPGCLRLMFFDRKQHYEREDCMFHAFNIITVFLAMGLPGVYLPGAQVCRGHSEFAQVAAHTNDRKKLMGLFTYHHTEEPEPGKFWWHTHGMEHYGLPDVECWYDEQTNPDKLRKVVQSALLELIPLEEMPKRGEAVKGIEELLGKYYFTDAEPVEDHEFGPWGVQGITKQLKKGWKFWQK